jgi:cation:H+ antiporter
MIIVPILLLLAGLILLWLGADLVIESAKKLSQRFRLSHAFIGLTIVSIGTSLPEIFTTIFSSIDTLKGIPASAVGVGINIGSCINIMTLVVGVVAFGGILRATSKTLSRDGIVILLSILVLFLFGMDGNISRAEGVILVLAYLVYLLLLSKDEHEAREKNPLLYEPVDAIELKSKGLSHHPVIVSLIMLGGLILLGVGSNVLVKNALKISDTFHLTQTFVGVIILSIGGALPELTTAIRGIPKKTHELSLGVLIGSCINDPLFSMGIGAIISGLSFDKGLLEFELPFLALTVLTVMLLLRKNMRIKRHEKKQGIVLISLYFIFLLMKIFFFRRI